MENTNSNNSSIALPEPVLDGSMSLEAAIKKRRSIRSFSEEQMESEELAQMLWAMQGITDASREYRAAPSAGATYPLEIIAVVGNVNNIEAGVYRYLSHDHALSRIRAGDRRAAVSAAALDQNWMLDAPVIFLIAAVPERTTRRYDERGERYVKMEAGHVAQNLQLQAVAAGYASTPVGAFNDADLKQAAYLSDEETPLYVLPVGKP